MESFFVKNLAGKKFESVSGLNCETRSELPSPISVGEEFTISENQAIFPAQSVQHQTHCTSYGTFPSWSLPPPSTEAANNDESDSDSSEDPELTESQRKEERKRIEKHRQMEGEREKVRKDIRDKYGLKKRDSENTKKKKKQRSTLSPLDDRQQQLQSNKNSPSLQRTESPSRPPTRPMTSQSKADDLASKISSCVIH